MLRRLIYCAVLFFACMPGAWAGGGGGGGGTRTVSVPGAHVASLLTVAALGQWLRRRGG